MNLFDIILKLIQSFHLVGRDKYAQLSVEVEEWESKCVETSDDKLKSMYAKLHKGVMFRLITPFIYFFIFNHIRDIESGEDDDFLKD